MSERVEEIRRRFEDDPSSDNVFDATDVAILLTALAQAERERDYLKTVEAALNEKVMRYDREVGEARAEVERLKALAYMGEHHFPDLTWKHRAGELIAALARHTPAPEGEQG